MATRFITYHDLDDLRDRRKRAQINAYINSTRKEHRFRTSKRTSKPPLEWQHQPQNPALVKVEPGLAEDSVIERPSSASAEDVDDAPSLPGRTYKAEALATPQTLLDGFRRDPFASFPVTQSGQVLWAADYFTRVYARDNASLYSDEKGNWLLNRLFSLALQSDMLFEAIILSMSRLHPAGQSAIVPGGVRFSYYRTSVISKLHRRLAVKEKATDDITIHTIIALISADFFAGHDENAATHLKGLQAIVASRGGLEHGDFDRFTIYNLTGCHALCQFASERYRQCSAAAVKPQIELIYPEHPYSPSLCALIATLPVGFGDIAIDGRLSVQIIKLLARLASAAQDSPLRKDVSVTEVNKIGIDLLSFMSQRSVTPLERSICVLCFMFNIRDGLQATRNKGQQIFGEFLGNLKNVLKTTSETFMSLEGCTADLAIWGVAILTTVSTAEGLGLSEEERGETLARLVRRHPRTARYWNEIELRVKRFFFPDAWIEEFHIWWKKEMAEHAF
ncbi:hypothetical protein G647_06538 [Cladophialophora carrionii CBS 160.54]|uniref:Uncharacterized protein n=1 Tax=Cladophialophora carrionii CBS 160.54 TaxID=1279043 RepID=V9D843_9EURO|nr:uncharacterized protein G647_06538 [Cladophialophora carrionii CBS 160.54]ETI22463.1 hypothetical protein G647_06538 [Cladophialophora carrionii CBS 160.54]